jgi:hypothetical protein
VPGLAEAESAGVGGAEKHAKGASVDSVEKAGDLLGRANEGEFARPLAVGKAWHDALPRTGYLIEEAQGGDGLVVGGPGNLLFLKKVEDVTMGMVEAELVGRLVEIKSVLLELEDVDLDGVGGAVAELEIFDETLAQSSHG